MASTLLNAENRLAECLSIYTIGKGGLCTKELGEQRKANLEASCKQHALSFITEFDLEVNYEILMCKEPPRESAVLSIKSLATGRVVKTANVWTKFKRLEYEFRN